MTEADPAVCQASPTFGPATATFIVVSSMIGTGVLTTSGFGGPIAAAAASAKYLLAALRLETPVTKK